MNQYFTPKVYYTTKNLFKTSDRLLFSLLSYFSNMKKVYSHKLKTCYLSSTENVCSKQVAGSFLVYSVDFVIRKPVCSNQADGCFCNTKNVSSKQARGCFLI